jgi:carboxymethylenebutenolidase
MRPSHLALCAALAACQAPAPGDREPAPRSGPPLVDMLGSMDQDAFKALHQLAEEPDHQPRGRAVTVPIDGGAPMVGYLSLPPDGPDSARPCVLVIHEWWGLNRHIQLWTDRLASEGYAALAVDLYQGTVATTRDEALAAMRAVDSERALAVLIGARRWLVENQGGGRAPSASIGWCFGGGWSLALALRDAGLDAAVVHYGRAEVDPELAASMRARVLGIFGERDAGITPEYVDGLEAALREAGVDCRFERFDAEHAFANPSSARYDHQAATSAWEITRAFLRETLGDA